MQEKFNLIGQLLLLLLIITMVYILIKKNISARHNFCLQVLCPLMLLNIRKFQCKHSLDIQKKVQLLGIAKLTLIVGLLSQDTWVHGYFQDMGIRQTVVMVIFILMSATKRCRAIELLHFKLKFVFSLPDLWAQMC